MLWLAGFIALMAVVVLAFVLRRRRPRDADLIMRRERAMVALADINSDWQHQATPPPTDLGEAEVQRGNVTILHPDSLDRSLRAPARRRTRSQRPVKRQPPDLTNRPTIAHLPSLPGAEN